MKRRGIAVVLPALVVAALLAACGGGDDEPAAQSSSSTSSSTASTSSSGPAPSSTPATDKDTDGGHPAPPFPANTEPDTGQASPGAAVTVTGIRVARHDGFDRVVFDVAGKGTPGWDVRYVPAASSQGSGQPIAVEGAAILQVALTGVGYPTDTGIEEYGGDTVPGSGTAVVTEVVWDTTFEGTSVAFVGLSDRTPFRVHLLEAPTRVVVDVVDPG
jgi:hypothetical protein